MNQDGAEQSGYAHDASRVKPDASERVKQAPGAIGGLALAPARKTFSAVIPIPKVEPLGSDRGSRRLARLQKQELAEIGFEVLKAGLAIRSVVTVTGLATDALDQTQEDVLHVYYQRDREPGANEQMKRAVEHNLQQAEVRIGVLTDLHFQNLTDLMQHG